MNVYHVTYTVDGQSSSGFWLSIPSPDLGTAAAQAANILSIVHGLTGVALTCVVLDTRPISNELVGGDV